MISSQQRRLGLLREKRAAVQGKPASERGKRAFVQLPPSPEQRRLGLLRGKRAAVQGKPASKRGKRAFVQLPPSPEQRRLGLLRGKRAAVQGKPASERGKRASKKGTVKFTSSSQYHLNMTDLLGQNVPSTDGAATEGINVVDLNLSSLAKGVNMMTISISESKTIIRTVIQ